MNEVRMEYTAGRGKSAEVWVDGQLLEVCDNISPEDGRTPPGLLEDVDFRYTTNESVSWDQAVKDNPMHLTQLVPEQGWRYMGYGRVESVMPVVIHFGTMRMEDPNWCTDDTLVGKFVCVPIDRLDIIPLQPDDFPDDCV